MFDNYSRVVAKGMRGYALSTSQDFASKVGAVTDDRTPLGRAVEAAREAKNLSVREAAERAGFSEGRWRQIVKGYQSSGAHQVPANPRRRTVIAMAKAVGLDVNEALALAGFDPDEPPVSLVRPDEESDERPVDVIEAILADPYLLPEAKEHFLTQYTLLLRVQAMSRGAGKTPVTEREIPVTGRGKGTLSSLPAVAYDGDPAHAEQVAAMAREIRARIDRERGDDGD